MKDGDTKACKAAAMKLHEKLVEEHGAGAFTGCGVGLDSTGGAPAIRVYVKSKKTLAHVPSEFEGFEVVAVVTGVIRAGG